MKATIDKLQPKYDTVTGQVRAYKYRINLCIDPTGKGAWKTKVFPIPEGLPKERAKKAVANAADAWEKEIREEYKKQQDAEALAREQEAQSKAEEKNNITLARFIDTVWLPLHVHDGTHTPAGIAHFEYTSKPIKEYFGTERLQDIDSASILAFIKYLRKQGKTKDGKPLSEYTIYHYFNTLRNVINFAELVDYIEKNPIRKLRKTDIPTKLKPELEAGEDFLTPEQASDFIKAIESARLEHRALIMTMIYTGVRRGELCGLQWADIDELKGTITVQRNVTRDASSAEKIHIGPTKTKSNREIPIGNELLAILQDWKKEMRQRYGADLLPNAFIFGKAENPYAPMYPTVPTTILYRLEERYGLPKVSPHDLRHTFGTMAAKAGGLKAAQTLLGHSDISTTGNFYLGVSSDEKQEVVNDIEKMIKKA